MFRVWWCDKCSSYVPYALADTKIPMKVRILSGKVLTVSVDEEYFSYSENVDDDWDPDTIPCCPECDALLELRGVDECPHNEDTLLDFWGGFSFGESAKQTCSVCKVTRIKKTTAVWEIQNG